MHWDRPVLVAHAPLGDYRVIVYMHGLCGDPAAFRSWESAAVRFGTVISLSGEERCSNGRYRWGLDPGQSDLRIRKAIEAVGAARGEPLDADTLAIIGYSQGAARAVHIAGRFPDRYRRVVLIADPTSPSPAALRRAGAVALIGGELDLHKHLRESADELTGKGLRAAYFELPRAHHGEYGPEGERVLGEALAWAFAE